VHEAELPARLTRRDLRVALGRFPV